MLTLLLGTLGLLELLFPERVLEVSKRLTVESPDDCEWKPWVATATRLEGLVFVLLALRRIGGCPGRRACACARGG
ncbi:hypothetical protein [Halomarina pelagica]|uniref:hypothetical protein n=1 Tax=Halomarina pelagica TaxID=2961599 RepID=UPI0020C23F77|nr:hypothetical protein [Halomarina sp. BND7]